MKVYNTLTKQLETLPSPAEQKKLNMFVCGPTVYDYIHIGNTRTFVVFDVIAKYLKHKGFDVTYIQNITDIDDKIIKRAHDEGTTPQELSEKYTTAFLEDTSKLGVDSAEYVKASEYIPQIIAQVQKLIDRGYAYPAPAVKAEGDDVVNLDGASDVYFDIQKYEQDFPGEYCKLSGQIIENLEAEKRVEMEKNKKHPRDFVLWKSQNYTYDWATDSPWGKGRPGWHIEDTTISEHFFGPQFDIHGGGQDLMFPHHEAEIAQQQAASGKIPFVKYWMHSGFLVNKDEKMSKSLGNFLTLRKALEKYSPEVLRFYFLSAHYRSPLDFSDKLIKANEHAIRGIYEFITYKKFWHKNIPNQELDRIAKEGQKKIIEALDNDFNTAEAVGHFFDTISSAERIIRLGHSSKTLDEIVDFMDKILGIVPKEEKIPKKVESLNKRREEAKKTEDFVTADQIRKEIEIKGWQVEDTVNGTIVIKKNK